MSDGFAFGDIIIFAAVAAFIVLRYRSMLGEKTGRDPADVEREREERRARAMQEVERVIQLPQKAAAASVDAKVTDISGHEHYDERLRDMLDKAQKIDTDFTAEGFLEGAKSAFEMVIEAYSKQDNDTLKMLLLPALFTQFSDALKADAADGKMAHNTLVAITKASINDVVIAGNQATITVSFTSDQIQLIRDADGAIIEGDASDEVEIDDVWVFTRDLKSASPNWVIIET